jgi:hypothetical protein
VLPDVYVDDEDRGVPVTRTKRIKRKELLRAIMDAYGIRGSSGQTDLTIFGRCVPTLVG